MAISLGFNNSGANPFANAPTNPANPFSMSATTPQSKALATAAKPPMPTVATPTTAVKQQTVTHPDGTTVQQTYHTPDTSTLGAQNQNVPAGAGTPGYTYTNGILSSVGGQPTGNSSGLLSPSNTANNTTSGLINTGGTTPSGAVVDAQGNVISAPPVSSLNTATSGLMNNAGNSAAIGQSAADIAAKYGKQISDVGQQAAINEESVGGQGLLPTAMGRAQQIATTANSAQNALAAGESAALEGTGQQLTANSNATSALNAAGGLSTPSNQFLTTPYSNQVLDSNGQPVGGTGGTLQTAVSNAINQIKAGGGYQAAQATLNSFGPAGTNALLTALGPNFNINASNAEAAAQASNINTQGTLNTNIGAQGAQQATSNYVAAKTAYDTASQQATNLQNTLATTGINNNPQFVNQKINALQNQLGSANYASFITALNETKQAYTSLLSSVGASTPTVNGQQATDIFNENSTPAQINAAIDALNQASYAKLQPLYEQIGTYSNIGSSGSGSSSTANPWH